MPAWMKRLSVHAAELYALDAPVVLLGDATSAAPKGIDKTDRSGT